VAIKTGLEGKPWYFGAAIGVFLGATVFGLGWWRFISPMKDQLAQGEQTITVWLSDFYGTSRQIDWGGLMAGTTWPGDPNSSAEPRRRERSRRGIDSESTSSS